MTGGLTRQYGLLFHYHYRSKILTLMTAKESIDQPTCFVTEGSKPWRWSSVSYSTKDILHIQYLRGVSKFWREPRQTTFPHCCVDSLFTNFLKTRTKTVNFALELYRIMQISVLVRILKTINSIWFIYRNDESYGLENISNDPEGPKWVRVSSDIVDPRLWAI